MKIGIDLTATWRQDSGLTVYARELAAALIQGFPEDDFALFVPSVDVAIGSPNVELVVAPWRSEPLTKNLWIPRVVNHSDLDVMHFPVFPPPLVPLSVPTVMSVGDTTPWDHPDTMRLSSRRYFTTLTSVNVARAATICTYLNDTADRLPSVIGCRRERVFVTPLAPRCLPEAVPVDIGGDPFALVVATIEPRKNLGTLISAAALADRRGAHIPLIIVGGRGWKQDDVHSGLTRDSTVRYLGHVAPEHLAWLYKHARFLVTASLYEGFGLTPLEAAAAGCPAVMSDIAAHREVFGEDGLYFNPQSAESLASVLQFLWADGAARLGLVQRQQARANAFTWAETARTTHRAYEVLQQ